jgi:hypothetical protein
MGTGVPSDKGQVSSQLSRVSSLPTSDFALQTPPSCPAAERTKRTQFLPGEIPHRSSIPIRHHSCETNPIRRTGRLAAGSPVVQTNPIGRSSSEEGRLCEETKPIWAGFKWEVSSVKRTEQNVESSDCGTCETKPIGAIRRQTAEGRLYKRSQFGQARLVSRGPIVRNKPNFRRMPPPFHYSSIPAFQSDAYCAKQTQFGQSSMQGQVLCGKRVMTNWTRKMLRQNKANFHRNSSGRGLARRPVPPPGPIVRNKANSPDGTEVVPRGGPTSPPKT